MRSIPMYLLLPMLAVAGTAIPIDPARAAGLQPCTPPALELLREDLGKLP